MTQKNAPPLNEKQRRRIETASPLYRGILEAAIRGTASPRQAIKAQCLECNGFERAAITTCTATACPLFPYRPYQKASGEQEELTLPPEDGTQGTQ